MVSKSYGLKSMLISFVIFWCSYPLNNLCLCRSFSLMNWLSRVMMALLRLPEDMARSCLFCSISLWSITHVCTPIRLSSSILFNIIFLRRRRSASIGLSSEPVDNTMQLNSGLAGYGMVVGCWRNSPHISPSASTTPNNFFWVELLN